MLKRTAQILYGIGFLASYGFWGYFLWPDSNWIEWSLFMLTQGLVVSLAWPAVVLYFAVVL